MKCPADKIARCSLEFDSARYTETLMFATMIPSIWVSLEVLATLLLMLGGSAATFWALVRRWESHRESLAMADWGREQGLRPRGTERSELPAALSELLRLDPHIRVCLAGQGLTLLQVQTSAVSPPGGMPTLSGPATWNVLVCRISTEWLPTGLRPSTAHASILDLFSLSSFPMMGSTERFTLFGTDSVAAEALSKSMRALPASAGHRVASARTRNGARFLRSSVRRNRVQPYALPCKSDRSQASKSEMTIARERKTRLRLKGGNEETRMSNEAEMDGPVTKPQDYQGTSEDRNDQASGEANSSHYEHQKKDLQRAANEGIDGGNGQGDPDRQPGRIALDRSHGQVVAETPDSLNGLRVSDPKHKAAGLPAVLRATQYVWEKAGVVRGTYALSFLNQKGGIDCNELRSPDPDGDRSFAEFCENGAKAIGHEADTRKCGPEFFAAHSVAELSTRSDYWLEQQGRLTHPMVLRPGGTHYEPISWDESFRLIANELNKLAIARRRRVLHQRPSKQRSRVPLPALRATVRDQQPSRLLQHVPRVQWLSPDAHHRNRQGYCHDRRLHDGRCHLDPRPESRHQPSAHVDDARTGEKEGMHDCGDQSAPGGGAAGIHEPAEAAGDAGQSDEASRPVSASKDQRRRRLLKGIMKEMLEDENRAPGTVFDWAFIRASTHGVEELLADIEATSWEAILEDCQVSRALIRAAAEVAMRSQRIICCWAMGLTQHENAVETIQEVVNLLLLRGSMGKPGAGACPVRGHSNVQGDRTMGIWERPGKEFLDSLKKNFDFEPPRHHGLDVVESIKAMHDGRLKIFIQLGGNFLSATPDTLYVQEGLSKLDLTVRIGTKLNRTDLITGKQALILPCLGRSEIDRRAGGEQFVSSENSMGVVQSSRGRLEPASAELCSEVAIICGIADATLGSGGSVKWAQMSDDYDRIREAIAKTISGCEDYNQKVRKPGGFYLPNHARHNEYITTTGKANFTVNPIPQRHLEPGQLILMTIRSHDQFNTTIYGLHDRYRGIHNERRIILMNKDDIAERGLEARQTVNITSHFNGQTRERRISLSFLMRSPGGAVLSISPREMYWFPSEVLPHGAIRRSANTSRSQSPRHGSRGSSTMNGRTGRY